MEKAIFDNRPDLTNEEGRVLRINFDVEEYETVDEMHGENEDDEPVTRTQYKAYVVRVKHPVDYDQIVSAIVDEAYSIDRMQAIINNKLLADGDAKHEEEYNEMQQWRAHAKEIAKQVLGIDE